MKTPKKSSKKLQSKKSKKFGIKKFFTFKKSIALIFVIVFGSIGTYFVFFGDAARISVGDETDQYNRIDFTRASRGKNTLFRSDCLSRAAKIWASIMADQQYMRHSDYASSINGACGGEWKAIAENVGRGANSVSIFDAFMASPPHAANILSLTQTYDRMGVGAAYASDGRLYVAQLFAYCPGCGGNWSKPVVNLPSYISLVMRPGETTGYKINDWGEVRDLSGKYLLETPGLWPNDSVIRSAGIRNNGPGYKLDKYGGLHPFNGAPKASGGPYWPGWDIARDVKLANSSNQGYVLDGFGGVHAFNGAPAASGGAYWSGWDIANKFALKMNSNGTSAVGGYVMTGLGSLHPFKTGNNPLPPSTHGGPWFPNDIARSIAMNPQGTQGYILDGYGGLHPFCAGSNCTKPPAIKAAYWPGWDIARDIVITDWSSSTPQGRVLDELGGIHTISRK